MMGVKWRANPDSSRPLSIRRGRSLPRIEADFSTELSPFKKTISADILFQPLFDDGFPILIILDIKSILPVQL